MAAASLLALLDDIALVLDDIAIMTKVAGKKTAGVLGDDLALNAQQVSGVSANRELPVIWAVAKGSAVNKLILVPIAIGLSIFLPMLILPLLLIGGAFLCYEGCEKLAHVLFTSKAERDAEHQAVTQALCDQNVDMVEFEKNKIKGAIRTDFILSAELIVIALGTVADKSLTIQIAVVTAIAAIMTIGVYSLVALIVKMDDAGLALLRDKNSSLKQQLGNFLLWLAPRVMKTLSIVGTAAMFMVGGGILVHAIPGSHDQLHHWSAATGSVSLVGPVLGFFTEPVVNAITGLVGGAIVLAVVTLISRMFKK